VARTKSSDESFSLSVQYQLTYTAPALQSWGGDALLRMPAIGDQKDNADKVAVQQLRVAVWVPEIYGLIGTPDHFSPDCRPSWKSLMLHREHDPDLDRCLKAVQAWIGDETGGLADFPTEGHAYTYTNLGGSKGILVGWWNLPRYTWVIGGALVVIAFVLRNTRWENKLTILLVGAFLAAAYALKDPDAILHGLIVASYGLAALAALWIIHAIFGRPRKLNGPASPPPPPPATVIPPPENPVAPVPAT
jgi:hypothetical protein